MYSGQTAAYGGGDGVAYYNQWDYGQMSPYYHTYHHQQQQLPQHQGYHLGYNQQQQYGQHNGLQQQQQYRDELAIYHHSNPMNSSSSSSAAATTPLPPGRSPSGSHSTPSPHSQSETPELADLHPMEQQQQHHQLKRSHMEAFRSDLGGGLVVGQNMMAAAVAAAAAAKKPKVSRRKKKRDPNEPQKPVSAYALFFRDSQAAIKARNPNLSFGDVSKMVASLWDSLDAENKALYKKRTEMAKKEYLRQLASYRASLVSKGGDDMYGYAAAATSANGGYYNNGGGGMGHPSMGLGQSIPPHPPGPYLASSPDYHQVCSAAGTGCHLKISGFESPMRLVRPGGQWYEYVYLIFVFCVVRLHSVC
jgi:hypothetical protein